MDEGPCTNWSTYTPYEVEVSTLENVLATEERLAFFSGYVRQVFELTQLILATVVTGSIPPEEGMEDLNDG